MANRREFLTTTAAAGLGLGLGGCQPYSEAGGMAEGATSDPLTDPAIPKADRPLNLLLLGGTGFLGPAEVEYALARGHTVTLFNRGRTNADLFPGVEKLVGDRAAPDLSALEGRSWDAVLDTSANIASWVEDSAAALEGSVGRYLFVSSVSAHPDNSIVGQTEDGPVYSHEQYVEALANNPDQPMALFGEQKAEAERIVHDTFGDRGLVVRPGLIVGPGDGSDRFTLWPVRIDRGGEVAAPGDGTDGAQVVDVRDLGRFLIHLLEVEANGTYNAVGPRMSFAEMLYGIRAITSSEVRFTWLPADFLEEQGVGWREMPMWAPPTRELRGYMAFDGAKAVAAGLTFRPLADIARDTLEWWKSRPAEDQVLRTGMEPEREQALLAAWRARRGS